MGDKNPTYDTRAALHTLMPLVAEADPEGSARRFVEQSEVLLCDLATLKNQPGIETESGGDGALVFRIGYGTARVVARPGKFVIQKHDGFEWRHYSDVVLTLDPVHGNLRGERYTAVDAETGEQITRYRDALVTLVQSLAGALRRS